jgi:hypothetical protein
LLGVHSRYGLHTRAVTVFRDTLSEGFSHFVTSMTAPVASGWSVRRVGFAPTGKRRLVTAHGLSGHCADCREMWRFAPRHGSLIGGIPRSSSGSLVKFAAMRRASSPSSSSKYAVDENKDALDRGGESVEGYWGHTQGVKVSEYPNN